ncbi:MAG: DUF2332 domain-containing protein, partial [Hyphomicrobiales bacterium]|nr:DUF2332 domain-containing protein [Hyphomicrobiales bacterium]
KVLDWPGPPDALGDAVALRLAGALHGLVRRGRLPGLAQLYPPNRLPQAQTLARAVLDAIGEADAEIVEWLQFPPQTNEVARSAVLYPGLMLVAQETGLPLSLFEVGASAGLNLFPERFLYRMSDMVFGQPGSPVSLSPQWSGALPIGPEPAIVSRRGCDRAPLNVGDAAHRERLVAYVWPDQPDRIARVEGAIEIARASPPRIDAADAADWVDEVIGRDAKAGVARVLFHSIAYQYFPDASKQRIAARMDAAGQAATAEAPLGWLAFEQFEREGPRLTLRVWPGGQERMLARADAHGRKIEWLV